MKMPSLLLALALAGCAASPRPVRLSLWTGSLNVRGGAAHPGSYLLTLSDSDPVRGEYAFEGARCLQKGKVSGQRSGNAVELLVTDGVSALEVKVVLEGSSYYGVYRFTEGPCKGDWGATVATPAP